MQQRPALAVWLWALIAAASACVTSGDALNVDYHVSTLAQLQAAVTTVGELAQEDYQDVVTIYIEVSITLTAPLKLVSSVLFQGVLQPDGSRPVLDCGRRNISALTITGSYIEVAHLEFRHCHDSAVVVAPAGPAYQYEFKDVLFFENFARTTAAGAISVMSYTKENIYAVAMSFYDCSFVNNGVSSALVPSLGAAAISAYFGNYTMSNCSFYGNGLYLSDATATSVAPPVVFFWGVYPHGKFGGAYSEEASVDLTLRMLVDKLTFVNNTAVGGHTGQPIYLFAIGQTQESSSSLCGITLSNSVLANNSGGTPWGIINEAANDEAGTQGALGCSVAVQNTRFVNNDGAGYLSALFLLGQSSVLLEGVEISGNTNMQSFTTITQCDSAVVRNCTFSDNRVGESGLGLIQTTLGTLDDCVFRNNSVSSHSAFNGGGGLFATQMTRLTMTHCSFTHNAAGAHGGAVYVRSQITTFTFTDCLFANNTAAVGGGAVYYQAPENNPRMPATFLRCLFLTNSAAYGGAVVLNGANWLRFQNSSFTGNSAQSGGAVVVSNNLYNQGFEGCNFTHNRAQPVGALVDQTTGLLWDNACGPGGGGALCVVGSDQDDSGDGRIRVTLSACAIINNTAVYGGAVFVGQGTACALSSLFSSSACYSMDLLYCELHGNTADGGAGGAVYIEHQSILNVMCSAAQGGWVEELAPLGHVLTSDQWHNVTDYVGGYDYGTFVVPSELSLQQLPCRSWTGNIAASGGYGPLMASPPTNVTLVSSAAPTSILSQDLIPVYMNVTDWYNQLAVSTVPYSSVVAVASLPPEAASTVYDDVVVAADLGLIRMSNLRLQGTVGQHVVTVKATLAAPLSLLLATFDLKIDVQPCPANYVTTALNNQCIPCREGLYSIDPKALACTPCPANAICSDPNIGGGVLVPAPGFWNSHPFSAEMHPCDNVVACTAPGRSSSLAALQAEFVNATTAQANGTVMTTLLESYLSSLCADNYQGGGVLCGECSNGMGHVAVVTCKTCLPRRTVIAVHIILTLVTLLFISLTIRSSLTTARWHREEAAAAPPLHTDPSLPGPHTSQRTTPALGALPRHPIRRSLRRDPSSSLVNSALLPSAPDHPPHVPHSSSHSLNGAAGGVAGLSHAQASSDAPHALIMLGIAGGATDVSGALAVSRPGVAGSGAHSVDLSMPLHAGGSVGGSSVAAELGGHKGGDLGYSTRHSGGLGTLGGFLKGGFYNGSGEHHALSVEKEEAEAEEVEPQHMTIILILVSYLQVLAMPRRVPLLWPNMLIQMLDVVSMATSAASSLASFECLVIQGQLISQVIQTSMVQIMEPMVMMMIITAVWLARVLYKTRARDMQVPMRSYMKPRLILSACVIIFYVYPSITDVIISSFACQPVDSVAGVQLITKLGYTVLPGSVGTFWREELNQLCYSGQHWIQLWVIGIPGLVLFAVGVPAVCMAFLWSHRHRLEDHRFQALWGFLYEEFKPHSFYWEAMGELRKLLIIITISLVSNTRTGDQLQISLGILVAALLAQVSVKPYIVEAMNRLEALTLLALTITFYLLTFFVVNVDNGSRVREVLSVLIIVVNASTVLYLLYCLAVEVLLEVRISGRVKGATSYSLKSILTRSATSMRSAVKALPCWGGSGHDSPLEQQLSGASLAPPTLSKWWGGGSVLSVDSSARLAGGADKGSFWQRAAARRDASHGAPGQHSAVVGGPAAGGGVGGVEALRSGSLIMELVQPPGGRESAAMAGPAHVGGAPL